MKAITKPILIYNGYIPQQSTSVLFAFRVANDQIVCMIVLELTLKNTTMSINLHLNAISLIYTLQKDKNKVPRLNPVVVTTNPWNKEYLKEFTLAGTPYRMLS